MRLLPLILLASCSSLRAGWVKVDFLEGKISPVMVCLMRVGPEGDVEGKCVSLEAVLAAQQEREKQKEEDKWNL